MKNQKWVCFVVFVIFLPFYIIFKPNEIIGVDFFLLLLLCLIIYMAIFKCLYLIKNAFLLGDDEKKTVIMGTVLFLTVFLISNAIKAENFALISNISIEILVRTLIEELVFRVFLLGILIEGIPFSHKKPLPFYFAEDKRDIIKIVMYMLAISIIFSDLHPDWVLLDPNLLFIRIFQGFFFFVLPFVLTNKKIYAPWLIHYVNNLYVSG